MTHETSFISRRHVLKSCQAALLASTITPASQRKSFADDASDMEVATTDWPWWRGPSYSGRAVGKVPPLEWSEKKNVVWKVRVLGEGHATPCIVGKRMFLATANEEKTTQSLICCDRATGRTMWHTQVHVGGWMKKHKKNSHASATPASDGQHVFVVFYRGNAIWATAIDMRGRIVWQKNVGAYNDRYGYGSSPTIIEKSLIVAAESPVDGYLVALDRKTGETLWRVTRPKKTSYGPPVVATIKGRRQIVLQGSQIAGHDPKTGRELWHCQAPAKATACTLCFDDQRVYSSGGYPERRLYCIDASGKGNVTDSHIKWKHERRSSVAYVPTPLLADNRLYVVSDGGVTTCFRADDGHEHWIKRLGGGFSASPILAGDYVIAPNESGKTFVFRASDEFQSIAENTLNEGALASPVVCGGHLYLRTIKHVYCIGT